MAQSGRWSVQLTAAPAADRSTCVPPALIETATGDIGWAPAFDAEGFGAIGAAFPALWTSC